MNLSDFIPRDKSMSHRILFYSVLRKGETVIANLSECDDVVSTINFIEALQNGSDTVNCGESGATARIGLGVCVGLGNKIKLNAEKSLLARPMQRVIEPLRKIGADIRGDIFPIEVLQHNGLRDLSSITSTSAQVVSALQFAEFGSVGQCLTETPPYVRNHTELMLKNVPLKGKIEFEIFKDPSAVAFICPIFCAKIDDVYLNSTRIAYIKIMQDMGMKIETKVHTNYYGEDVGYINVLDNTIYNPVDVSSEKSPSLIDEYPILAALSAEINGISRFRGVAELKVKESNRVAAIIDNLRKFGVCSYEDGDDLVVEGNGKIEQQNPITISSYNDHRIAMAFSTLAIRNKLKWTVDNLACASKSFPKFYDLVNAAI